MNYYIICFKYIGKCVCNTGFYGDSCEKPDVPILCPNDCSSHGVCDFEIG